MKTGGGMTGVNVTRFGRELCGVVVVVVCAWCDIRSGFRADKVKGNTYANCT
jgi:hypothetical protein